jgi:hypothetical protein
MILSFKADLISFFKCGGPIALYGFYFLTNTAIYEKYTYYIFIGNRYISNIHIYTIRQ